MAVDVHEAHDCYKLSLCRLAVSCIKDMQVEDAKAVLSICLSQCRKSSTRYDVHCLATTFLSEIYLESGEYELASILLCTFLLSAPYTNYCTVPEEVPVHVSTAVCQVGMWACRKSKQLCSSTPHTELEWSVLSAFRKRRNCNSPTQQAATLFSCTDTETASTVAVDMLFHFLTTAQLSIKTWLLPCVQALLQLVYEDSLAICLAAQPYYQQGEEEEEELCCSVYKRDAVVASLQIAADLLKRVHQLAHRGVGCDFAQTLEWSTEKLVLLQTHIALLASCIEGVVSTGYPLGTFRKYSIFDVSNFDCNNTPSATAEIQNSNTPKIPVEILKLIFPDCTSEEGTTLSHIHLLPQEEKDLLLLVVLSSEQFCVCCGETKDSFFRPATTTYCCYNYELPTTTEHDQQNFPTICHQCWTLVRKQLDQQAVKQPERRKFREFCSVCGNYKISQWRDCPQHLLQVTRPEHTAKRVIPQICITCLQCPNLYTQLPAMGTTKTAFGTGDLDHPRRHHQHPHQDYLVPTLLSAVLVPTTTPSAETSVHVGNSSNSSSSSSRSGGGPSPEMIGQSMTPPPASGSELHKETKRHSSTTTTTNTEHNKRRKESPSHTSAANRKKKKKHKHHKKHKHVHLDDNACQKNTRQPNTESPNNTQNTSINETDNSQIGSGMNAVVGVVGGLLDQSSVSHTIFDPEEDIEHNNNTSHSKHYPTTEKMGKHKPNVSCDIQQKKHNRTTRAPKPYRTTEVDLHKIVLIGNSQGDRDDEGEEEDGITDTTGKRHSQRAVVGGGGGGGSGLVADTHCPKPAIPNVPMHTQPPHAEDDDERFSLPQFTTREQQQGDQGCCFGGGFSTLVSPCVAVVGNSTSLPTTPTTYDGDCTKQKEITHTPNKRFTTKNNNRAALQDCTNANSHTTVINKSEHQQDMPTAGRNRAGGDVTEGKRCGGQQQQHRQQQPQQQKAVEMVQEETAVPPLPLKQRTSARYRSRSQRLLRSMKPEELEETLSTIELFHNMKTATSTELPAAAFPIPSGTVRRSISCGCYRSAKLDGGANNDVFTPTSGKRGKWIKAPPASKGEKAIPAQAIRRGHRFHPAFLLKNYRGVFLSDEQLSLLCDEET